MINLSKNQIVIIGVVCTIVILVIGYYIYTIINQNDYEEIETISKNTNIVENNEQDIKTEEENIIVHIAGQVKKPGIVKIKNGARIADIIEAGGGLTEQADITNINLAYIVEDGQKISIPSKQENTQEIEHITTDSGKNIIKENFTSQEQDKKTIIDINKATVQELQQLQGIGESTAQKIIEYRKKNGNFKQKEDIKNVSGIGEAKYETIKENIKVK